MKKTVLVISRESFKKDENRILNSLYCIWVGKDVLEQEEIDTIRSQGIELTNFVKDYDFNNQNTLEDVLSIIREHQGDDEIEIIK